MRPGLCRRLDRAGARAQPQLKLRTFDQDTLSGPESQVSTAEVEPLIRPAMASLTDGGFVIVWADKRQDERIRAQRFAFEGTKNGPEFRANTIAGSASRSHGGRAWPTEIS